MFQQVFKPKNHVPVFQYISLIVILPIAKVSSNPLKQISQAIGKHVFYCYL